MLHENQDVEARNSRLKINVCPKGVKLRKLEKIAIERKYKDVEARGA